MSDKTDREVLDGIARDLAVLTAQFMNICNRMDKAETIINGDGMQPGLKAKVQILTTEMQTIGWIAKTIGVATIGAIVASVFALLRK